MVTLAFQFPGRRYHATPPGHHVNEGLVEWPPSSWRILRALVATGYTKLGWRVVPELGRSLLSKLASKLPVYHLPPTAAGHSRHYMPIGKFDKGRERTTLVLDTWAEVGSGELAVKWDVELSTEEKLLLDQLAQHMSYLGRAESWVVGRITEDSWTPKAGSAASPCESRPRPGPGWEQIQLLVPELPETYLDWRTGRVNQDQTVSVEPPGAKPAAKGKRGGKKASSRKSLEDQYPADLVACLEVDTTWLEANGWSQPPGARSALYWRNRDALEVGALSPRIQPPRARPVEAMLLALATQSGNMHALPTVARTLPQAELLHRALVRHILRIAPDQHETLTGRDEQRVPLEGHQHLHILPLDLDADGHLEHVLIWAPMGLNGASQEAVRAVRETFTKGGVGELRVALAGAGALDDMRTLQGPSGDTLRKILGPSDGARVWESATPFVAPRHIKKSGRGTVEGQISDELSSRSLPAPSAISIFNPQDEKSRSLRHIVRRRVRGPLPLVDFGFALRLEFAQPVQGPICLGYASHFGLGRFVAVE